MKHIFSVDVEEWFDGMTQGYQDQSLEKRLPQQMRKLLMILRHHNVQGTFFWLGSSALRYPDLVQTAVAEGHEIGCHGFFHKPIYQMTQQAFRSETNDAIMFLSDLTGKPVLSYRAPYFSLTEKSLWAFDILSELGILYDSSIFPIRHWRYGMTDFPLGIQSITTKSGNIIEAPLPVRSIGTFHVPATGGAYFRLYPYSFTKKNIELIEKQYRPVVFYMHPWELDPGHPRIPCNWKTRIPHYAFLDSMEDKLHMLLRDFEFSTLSENLLNKITKPLIASFTNNSQIRI